MLKQFAVTLPKSVSGENAFIYPLNVCPLDSHRIKRSNGASSTYWKSPYYGPDTKQLDIQFRNTELYNSTIRKQLEAKEKSVKSILKNSLPPSSLENCVSERSRTPERRKPEVWKPKYNLRQAPSPNQSRPTGKKEKRVKFDDRYGRLSTIESKYRLLHSKRKGHAKVRPEKTNIDVNYNDPSTETESPCRSHIDTSACSEGIEHEHDTEHIVSNSDQPNVCYLQETEGCIENPSISINDDRQLEYDAHEPQIIAEMLSSVHIVNDNGENDFQKKGSEMVLSFEGTDDVFCEQVPLLCDVNVGTPIDTSLGQVANKSPDFDVSVRNTPGKPSKPLKKSKTAPDLLMTRYAHASNDLRSRKGSLDDSHSFSSKIALGRRRISGKTTVNTLGGAVVTRSHIRPVMFSRSRESSQVPAMDDSRKQSYRNFCDKSKTNQIVNWLEQVKEIHSREGPCIQADSDIEENK